MKEYLLKRVVVLAPQGIDIGFKLGGATVKTVDEGSINQAIEALLEEADAGIVAIPQSMAASLSGKNVKTISKKIFPMVIYYPTDNTWESPMEIEDKLGEIVQRAIGYRLRINL